MGVVKVKNKKRGHKNPNTEDYLDFYICNTMKFKDEIAKKMLEYYDAYEKQIKSDEKYAKADEAYSKLGNLRNDGFRLNMKAKKFETETKIIRNEIRLRKAEQSTITLATIWTLVVSVLSILISKIDQLNQYIPILIWIICMIGIIILYFARKYSIENDNNKNIKKILAERRSLDLELICIEEFLNLQSQIPIL